MMEAVLANARHPQRGCRAVFFCAGLMLACGAYGEETGCEQVPEARRAQCLKVLSCLRVDDEDVRRACIDAAQEPMREAAAPDPQEEFARDEPPARAEPPARDEPPAHDEPPARDEPPPGNESRSQEAPTLREREVEPPLREASRPVKDEVPARPPREKNEEARDPVPLRSAAQPEPPDEWSGTISRIYQSILDRQLIAVDGKYLFESDRASHARLEAGEQVAVEKVSSRFFRGSRRWRIAGPSRTQIVAFRIHCESEDIRADDRRKCAQMLDR